MHTTDTTPATPYDRAAELFALRDRLNATLMLALTADAADQLPPEVTAVRFDHIDGYVNEHGLTIERYLPTIYYNGTLFEDLDPDRNELLHATDMQCLAEENDALRDMGYLLAEMAAVPGFRADLLNLRTGQ